MKSRAHIKGHPLHPILVSFPIAFFVGSLVFDTLGAMTSMEFHDTAKWMNVAGCIMALVAALPGFIDFLTVVPPHSSAKKRAEKHGLINVTVLLLFVLAYYLRTDLRPMGWVIITEFVAVALLMAAGWLGGTLVFRNQIGVDIRYAEAGKWKEIELDDSNSIDASEVKDLRENQMILAKNGTKRIVVSRVADKIIAFDDRCTHRGGSLAAGSLICGTVQCPWHGSHFDITTGAVTAGPATSLIKTYNVSLTGNRLTIDTK